MTRQDYLVEQQDRTIDVLKRRLDVATATIQSQRAQITSLVAVQDAQPSGMWYFALGAMIGMMPTVISLTQQTLEAF